jgi:competence protein ComEA
MFENAPDRRHVLAGALFLLLALALAARMLLRPSRASIPPPVRVATSTHSPAPQRLVVDVVGAVRRPGVYRLPDGSRVADAVARAGGPTPRAELDLVNLAARVGDGEQVVVPRQGALVGGVPVTPGGGAVGGPIHLNSATLEQLDTLPGIGPVTAQKIVDYRARHGPFGSLDELDAIPGIGPARLEQLRGAAVP